MTVDDAYTAAKRRIVATDLHRAAVRYVVGLTRSVAPLMPPPGVIWSDLDSSGDCGQYGELASGRPAIVLNARYIAGDHWLGGRPDLDTRKEALAAVIAHELAHHLTFQRGRPDVHGRWFIQSCGDLAKAFNKPPPLDPAHGERWPLNLIGAGRWPHPGLALMLDQAAANRDVSERLMALRVVADAVPLPWQRQAGETPKAFAAFRLYRDMGPRRSLRKLADGRDKCGSNVHQLARWSSRWAWPARAVAFDSHVDDETHLAQLEAQRQMVRQHAAVAGLMVAKAAERLRLIDPSSLSPREAVLLFEAGVKAERLSRGEPAEIVDSGDGEPAVRAVSGSRLLAALRANPKLVEFADLISDVVDVSGLPKPEWASTQPGTAD